MRTQLFGQEFKPTAAIRRHVERRVALALGAAARAVTGIVVRVRDLNARHGGVDKRCRMVVGFPGGSIAVGAVHRDLYAAVDAAAAKLRRAVMRRLRRRRTLRWQFDQRRAARRQRPEAPITF